MKKIAGLAVLIVTALTFAWFYRLQTLGFLDTNVYAVSEKTVSKALNGGIDEADGDNVIPMTAFEGGSTLYKRGNRYYIGEDKAQVDLAWPFYANGGTSLYFMGENTNLIASDFASFPSYEDLFISNGASFAGDSHEKTDDEEYIMASVSGGLFLNVQPMKITGAGQTTEIRLNSILYMTPSLVRSYSFEDGRLVYAENPVMSGSVVTVGSVSMTWDEFLKQLGKSSEYGANGTDAEQVETPEENLPLNGANLTQGNRNNSGNGSEEDAITEEISGDQDGAGSGSGSAGENGETLAADQENGDAAGNSSAAEGKDGISGSDGSGYSDGNASMGDGQSADGSLAGGQNASSGGGSTGGNQGSTGGSGSNGGSSGANGSSSSGGSGSGNSSSSGSGSSGSGSSSSGNGSGSNGAGSGNNNQGSDDGKVDDDKNDNTDPSPSGYTEPTAELGTFTAKVYEAGSTLTINDPDTRLVRVVVEFIEKDTGKRGARKNLRQPGSFQVQNLKPDTEYRVRGSVVFRNASGVRETKVFVDDISVKTLPISTYKPLTLKFGEAKRFYSNRILIPDIVITDTLTAEDGESLRDYVSKIMVMIPNQTEDYREEAITGAQVRNARNGRAVNWLSDEVFASDKEYPFTLKLVDRHGNELPLTADSVTEGTAHTCKRTPTATITETANEVGKQTINVKLTNRDGVKLENLYLKVVDEKNDALPAFARRGDDPSTKYYLPLDEAAVSGDGETITITELPAGISCRVLVTADYDMKDTDPSVPVEGGILGKCAVYTAPISRLGNYYMNMEQTGTITATSFAVKISTNTARTLSGLRELTTELPLTVTNPDGQTVYESRTSKENGSVQIFSEEYLSQEKFTFGNSVPDQLELDAGEALVKPLRPVITMSRIPAGSTNAWEALVNGATVELAFPEGQFASKTIHTVHVGANAYQGGTMYQVGSSTNTCTIKTMLMPAKITYENLFTISDFCDIYGLYIDDPDGAVRDGNVTMRVYTQGSQVSARNLKTNTRYDDLKLERLRSDSEYYIYFEAAQYSEGYGNDTESKRFESATLKFRVGQGITGSIEIQGAKKRTDNSKLMDGSVRVRLIDRKEELVDESYELKVYGKAGVDSMDSELQLVDSIDGTKVGGTYELDETTNVLLEDGTDKDCPSTNKVITYPARYNWKYRVELWVNVKISSTSTLKVSLGSVTYTTEGELTSITTWGELVKNCANKSGHFVVTEDLVKDTDDHLGTFKGSIDFQGHKVTFSESENHTRYMCQNLAQGAVIENLEVEYNAVPHKESTINLGSIVYENYGTVRNVIVHVNWNSRYAHERWGGIAAYNRKTGVIENFVVTLDQTMYVNRYAGLVTYENNGTIRNGYTCSTPGQSGVSYMMAGSGVWGGSASDHWRVGGIAGSNVGGLIENVFSLINFQAENEGTDNIDEIGGIVGTMDGGTIRNAFWVGDIFQYSYKDNEMTAASIYNAGGGAIGKRTDTSNVTDEIYNISLQTTAEGKLVEYGYSNGKRTRNYAVTETTQALWNSIWYKTTFRDPDQYLIDEEVTSGLYPKIILTDELMPEQAGITLPSSPAVSRPEYISSEVESQDVDSAVLKMYLRNPYSCEITGFTIDGLETDSILSQGMEGDYYEVRLKVKNPQKFKSYYLLTEIRFKWSETTSEDSKTYTEADDKKVRVKFYKQIRTAEDWMAVLDDPASNFQLAEPVVTINLNEISADKVVVTKAFTGEFDGNGNTLKFAGDFPAGQSFVFDAVTDAKIYDLTVEGLSFATDESNSSNVYKAVDAGFIKSASRSELTNIFLKDVSMLGMPGTTGALAGTVTNCAVTDCRAEGVTIQTVLYNGRTLRVGGLLGYSSNSTVQNCYVSGLTLNAEKGADSTGIGGLIGVITGNFGPESCYAEGSIKTDFWGTGGLVGNSLAPISSCWTYVNINSNANAVGGILGRAPLAVASDTLLISNCVSIGDIVTGASSGYGRIFGFKGNGTVNTQNCGANKNQIIGIAANTSDKKDATYLVGENEADKSGLGTIEFYRDDVRLGNGYVMDDETYSIDAGYMPLLKKNDRSRFDPEQTPIQRREERLKVINISMSAEPSGTYKMEIQAEAGDSGYKVLSASCEDLGIDELNKDITWNDAAGQGKLTYTGVSYKRFIARYQIQVTFEHGNARQTVTYQLAGTMARQISNIDEWREVMKEHGQEYENIELTGDIDFSGVSQKELVEEGLVNLKLNSIKGNDHTIKNFTYTAQADGESMIKVLNDSIENVNFEDMTFSAVISDSQKYGGTNVGIIGELNGSADHITFTKVTVNAPAATQVGCIGSAKGTIQNVTLKDLEIHGKSSTGGLIGYFANGGVLKNVTAEGTTKDKTKNYAYYKEQEALKATDPTKYKELATKPKQEDYSYVVTGNSDCGGILGLSYGELSNIAIRGAYIGSGTSNERYRGGIVGRSYWVCSDLMIGDIKDETIPVQVVGGMDTAGAVGYCYWSPAKVERAEAYHIFVNGTTNTAGLVGQDTKAYNCRIYQSTITGKDRVAGIMAYGSGDMARNCEVRECDIYGTSQVAGIAGEGGASRSALFNSTVTGSSMYIGGVTGYDRGEINYCSVTGSKIIGAATADAKASVVGGLIGFGNASNSYVADTEVSGYRTVGGAVGWTAGNCENISVEADVSAVEGYAGGFTGILTSFSHKSLSSSYSERFPTVHDITVGGTVKAALYAGGFAGIVETYPPEHDSMTGTINRQGADGLDGNNYYNIQLMLKEISCTSSSSVDKEKVTMWGYFTQDRLVASGQIYGDGERTASHPIYSITPSAGRKLRSSVWVGTTVTDSNRTPFELISEKEKTAYQTWDKANGSSWDMAWTTTEILKSEDFWKSAGLSGHDEITDALNKSQVPWRAVIDSTKDGVITWTEGYSSKGIPTDGWWADVKSNTWTFVKYVDGTARTSYGYYDGKSGSNYADVFQSPGVFEIPESTKGVASLDGLGDDLVTCYASGAGLLNIELADGLKGVHISVKDSSRELLSADADRRVYTMPYDFSAPLTVTLSAGNTQSEYKIAASSVVHTVMSWKGKYYYLTSKGVYWSKGAGEADENQKVHAEQNLIKGEFLNLYGGYAIDKDGAIWNVDTGEKEKTLDFKKITWAETTPLHTFRYDGRVLDVYAHFTDSWKTEPGADAVRGGLYGNEEAEMLDTLPYVKNKKLFVLDGEAKIHTDAVLADSYEDSRYLTVLGTDGCMHDIEPAIKVPKGFKNRGILEMAGNMDDDSHIVIGRYGNGTVFAFNYLTGTEQVLENTYFDVGTKNDFISFATDWINSAIGSWFGFDNSGYAGSKKLMSEVSSGELDAALGALSGMEQGKDLAEDGSDSGVSGTGKNGTGTDSAGSDSADRVDNAGDPAIGDASDSGNEAGSGVEDTADRSDAADGAEDGVVSDDEGLTDASDAASENGNALNEADGSKMDQAADKTAASDNKKDANSADGKKTSDEEKSADSEKSSKEEKNTDSEKASKEETKAADKAKAAEGSKASSEAGTAGETKVSDGTGTTENGAVANTADGASADGTGETSIREISADASSSAGTDGSTGGKIDSSNGSNGSASGGSSNENSSQAAENGKADDSQKAENAAAGETSADSEAGTADAAATPADDDTTGISDAAGTAETSEKPASKSELVSVYDAETGKYQVYTVDELLSSPRSQISSVNEKITKLSREGLITRHSDLDAKEFVENNKKGVMIFGATAAAIVLLLILMAELRRDRKKN